MQDYNYPNIDMQRTGALLKKKVEEAGYSVRELQEKLKLSCPQPIYRWFKGKVLPSVNHLYALSQLLDVHMEELLVTDNQKDVLVDIMQSLSYMTKRRLCAYMQYVQQAS